MSYFCYTIEFPDGTCLLLAEDGVHEEDLEFTDYLKHNGFHHQEDRTLGENKLHVFKRQMPATDIVPPDHAA